jgi:hypothetical protein
MPFGGTAAWGTPIAGWDQHLLTGIGAGPTSVPTHRRLGSVAVLAGNLAAATCQVGTEPIVTIPIGVAWGIDFDGYPVAQAGGYPIVFGGDVASWVVTYWEAP